MAYSAQLLDHFRNPRHAGELADATVVAEAANPVCGDVIKIWLRLEQGRVVAASFKAAGCAPAIACGSWLAERLACGASVTALGAISPEEIETGLGGLPAASRHAAQLAVDALRKAISRLADQVPP
ncbi:MAG TPA: iron-sulfur cluster assembly scaffold protein [Terriglobia bacterium]|nr:iron-sulfur cluster assembly scaffold protein [Terriglobia bacterium]